jgi:hypothetical protein
MARPKTDPKVRAQALRRLRAGESARTVANDLGVSPTAVRNWLKHDAPAAPAVAPTTPTFDIYEVHDALPPAASNADELDAEGYARAMRAAATDDAPPASGTATDEPAAPSAGTPPETVVDLFEGAVGLCLRLVVVGKGGDWTPQLENACRFTPSERNRLLVTAPYVAQYVGDALRNSPYVGIALFGMSALEVVTARLALIKTAAPTRRLPNNRTTPPPAAQVDDDEEDLQPFPQTASPGVALVDFKANLGE